MRDSYANYHFEQSMTMAWQTMICPSPKLSPHSSDLLQANVVSDYRKVNDFPSKRVTIAPVISLLARALCMLSGGVDRDALRTCQISPRSELRIDAPFFAPLHLITLVSGSPICCATGSSLQVSVHVLNVFTCSSLCLDTS